MLNLGEAVARCDVASPVVEPAVAHLLDAPAPAAGEVVMVTAAADQERDLSVVAPERVGVALVGQSLEVPVHGREADALQLTVELLRGDRAVGRAQCVEDRLALLGSPAHKSKR